MDIRWEDNVLYKDYKPEAFGDWPSVDTFRVAEAVIYSADDHAKIWLCFLVRAQDLKISGMTKAAIIERAEQARQTRVEEWRARVEEQREGIQVLFDWRGQEMERRPLK